MHKVISIKMMIHCFFIGVIAATLMLNMAVAAAPTIEDEMVPTSSALSILLNP